jgi:antitoxin PrlF
MATSEVVKITSKGQMTLPVDLRRQLNLKNDNYVYVTRVGELIVMKKVNELSLDEISIILQRVARRSSITREMLGKDLERARERLMRERHVKTSSSP